MAITASKLRENVYNILDQVLETGVPVEIERGGHPLRIVAVGPRRRGKPRHPPAISPKPALHQGRSANARAPGLVGSAKAMEAPASKAV